MNVHTTTDGGGASRRLFQQANYGGEIYTNEDEGLQYVQTMQNSGLATDNMIQAVVSVNNHVALERELMNELWAAPNTVTGLQLNPIQAIDNVEAVIAAAPQMRDYLFTHPEIYAKYESGIIRAWDDYTPRPTQEMWETVNTGSTTMEDKSITIREYINKQTKLTVDERLCILDAQQYILEEFDEDPWLTEIVYY